MKPKTKFLTVVWGQTYIDRFAELSLPSFLAPGNLPALAENTDLEVLIMTSKDNIKDFEVHRSFLELRKICSVRFIEIDDLITKYVYGVILTLAYARAVFASGTDMVNTHFVFMNADFILADGSLRNLSKHILDGRPIVLGPSFRATAEHVEPLLEFSLDDQKTRLIMKPRDMVSLAMEHPHPTTLAKMVGQNFCHSTQPNQFFWQVDKSTILGRYFLIFMLCLKPERVITSVNSYCDYAFIPEMCPSGDTAVMQDSDDFFMLELQRHDQELFLLRFGEQPFEGLIKSLDSWTTAEHRRAAAYDIIFHSQDIPPALEHVKKEANEHIKQIKNALGRPVPHAFHHFWIAGVAAWKYFRRKQGQSSTPKELTKPSSILTKLMLCWRYTKIFVKQQLADYYLCILGKKPNVTLLHPDWIDSRLLHDAVNSLPVGDEAHLLVIRSNPEFIDRLFCKYKTALFIDTAELLQEIQNINVNNKMRFTHVFIALSTDELSSIHRIISLCQPVLDTVFEHIVFITSTGRNNTSRNSTLHLFENLSEISFTSSTMNTYFFTGGKLKNFNRNLFDLLSGLYRQTHWASMIFILPAFFLIIPLTFLCNIYLSITQPRKSLMQYCSSVLVRAKYNK